MADTIQNDFKYDFIIPHLTYRIPGFFTACNQRVYIPNCRTQSSDILGPYRIGSEGYYKMIGLLVILIKAALADNIGIDDVSILGFSVLYYGWDYLNLQGVLTVPGGAGRSKETQACKEVLLASDKFLQLENRLRIHLAGVFPGYNIIFQFLPSSCSG